jgi:hypothetical protein
VTAIYKSLLAIACLMLPPQIGAASQLAGKWRLDNRSLDRLKGQTPDGPVIETETVRHGSEDASKTIEIAGDVVTVVTTTPFGPPRTIDRYQLDGQPHSFVWGDTVPPETAIRTGRWAQDGDGFVLTETYWGTQRQEHRWTVSVDGQVLTIESTYDHQCLPCAPAVTRAVQVFTRQR